MHRTLFAGLLAGLLCLSAPAFAGATFDAVRQNGAVRCGVTSGVAGMARPESRGRCVGLHADICLAIAAERSASATTTDLTRKIGDREVDREVERARPNDAPADVSAPRDTPLLAADVVSQLRNQWADIQAGFVDEPRRAVERANGLVADAIRRLAETFSNERAQLERQWARGGDVSTEDLRQALQRYRSFFSRLLSV